MTEREIKEVALNILHEYFTYTEFKKEQEKCIIDTMSGKDVVAVLPTGAGKSLCFQIPALYFEGITIVITPLVALMHDQVAQLNTENMADSGQNPLKKTVPAVYIDSTVKGKRDIFNDVISENSSYKILYVSPERLNNPVFKRFAQKANISFVVIDEAHCMSMWGYDFRPVYLEIMKFINNLPHRPVLGMYTATATPDVIDDILKLVCLDKKRTTPKYSLVKGDIWRGNLSFSVIRVDEKEKKRQLLMEYLRNRLNLYGIIYCSTKKEVNSLYDFLIHNNINAAMYHAIDKNFDKKESEKNYKMFMNGRCSVMVATNAFGMGINKKDVRFVIHYNMPKDLESYYQEAGRAGRDGKHSECIIFYYRSGKKDDYTICQGFLERFRKNSDFDNEVTKHRYNLGKYRLDMMEQYCEMAGSSSDELQQFIADYFNKKTAIKTPEKYDSYERYTINQKNRQIKGMYYNNTLIANEIRKGNYTLGAKETVDVGGKTKKMPVSYMIKNEKEEKISYFDMMIADAVYTLWVNGQNIIYPKKIYELLTGDTNVTLGSKMTDIQKSIEKMMNTDIIIDKSQAYGKCREYEDDRKTKYYSGKFLPLIKLEKKGYQLYDTPPVYKFATAFNINGQFLTFAENILFVKQSQNVKLHSSIENVKLIYYLLARIKVMSSSTRGPMSANINRNGLNRTIRFDTLINVTKIIIPKEKYTDERTKKALFGTGYFEKVMISGRIKKQFVMLKLGKIDVILKHFKNMKIITGYKYIGDEYGNKCGKKVSPYGVIIDFM